MNIRRAPGRATLATASIIAALLTGCSSAPSPTRSALERGDNRASATEQRLAPMAARRRGILVAGDGFGRMAYSGQSPVATAAADAD